jgi:proprotein convertase subtilisin/kexin type 5
LVGFLCPPTCLTCSNAINCLTCTIIAPTQYYLSSGACIQSCPISYYDDPFAGLYICDACDISCSRCYVVTTNCTACNTAYGYVSAYAVNNSCVNFCPDGQYINYTAFTCSLCSTACLTCITKATKCLSCGTSLGGQLYLNGTTCIFNCPTATYPNSTLFACRPCDVSCATCNGPSSSNCLTCATVVSGGTTTIYYLAIGASGCATTCPDGQFKNSAIPNYCQQCSSLCVLCQGSANICTSCPTGFYLSGNTCLSTCNAGTYADTMMLQCVTCNSACSTCFGAGTSSCSTCKTDTNTGFVYYLSLGTTKCVTLCPTGQITGSNNLCVACAPQCATCSLITTNCTKCLTISGVTAVYLQNSNCVQTCMTGTCPQTAASGNLCLSCDPSCSSCLGPLSTSCTACTTYLAIVYYKDPANPTCSTSCPSGYFGVSANNTCSQCQAGCSSCQINSTYCQGCQNVGSIPYYLINNLCLNVCPNDYYPNGNLCSACHIQCATCTGPSTSQCSSCNNATVGGVFTQYYLAIRTSICSQFCPQGQYIDAGFPNSCQQCSSLCVYCFGNANNCTNGTCPYGYFFYINTCISVCFSGTYGNSSSW